VTRTYTITIGDLVRGTSMHNDDLIGIVTEFDPNQKSEYKVHWLVEEKHQASGFYSFYERYYDIEKVS
tara:strand:- start:83 stop:286 length:204 start_codon:yes stop_codon:yes gene_type:complete